MFVRMKNLSFSAVLLIRAASSQKPTFARGTFMPRRSILSASERESLLSLPDTQDELIRRYTLSEGDISIIRQRRGAANRRGFAIQLCYLRFPGVVLGPGELPFPPLLHLVAAQLKIPVEKWAEYGARRRTDRLHQEALG
jgi:TnpA family transposase